jgi:hypothetical protein
VLTLPELLPLGFDLRGCVATVGHSAEIT